MDQHLLGIDIGTASTKGVLALPDAGLLPSLVPDKGRPASSSRKS